MPYTEQTTITGPSRGSMEAWFAWAREKGAARLADVGMYLSAVYEIAPAIGVRAEVVVVQSIHETSDKGIPWNSAWWRQRSNPAGIGITGDPTQNNASRDFQNGRNAALAHLTHLWLYAKGTDLPSPLKPEHDPRWQAAIRAGYAGTCQTLADLTGTWASDAREPNDPKTYSEKLVDTLNALEYLFTGASSPLQPPASVPKESPMAVYQTIPKFGMVDRQAVTANKPAGQGWDNLGKRDVLGVVLHRMLGSLRGTDSFFRTANALTDFGIGVAATDGADLAGVIYQWNDPYGYRSGWASGPVSKPYGDGKAFVDKYGVNAVNRRLVSIEISGQATTPVDAFAWGELVQFVAWWADQCKVPWETFPLNPATGISFVIWHQEFTIGTGKECPFAWVMDNTDRLIADVKAMLQRYQTGATQPVSPPDPPTSATAYVRAVKEILVRAAPDVNARVGFALAPGEVAAVIDPTPRAGSGLSWLDVRMEGRGTGFVPVNDVEPASAPEPAPAPEPAGTTFRTRYKLPLRNAPGFAGAIVGELAEGTAGEILVGPREVDGIGWYRARLDGGRSGWVPASIVRTLEIDAPNP